MNKFKIIFIILFLFICMQFTYIFINKIKQDSKSIYVISDNKVKKDLKSIEKTLKDINNLKVIGYNKVLDNWNIKCNITGLKEDVKNTIDKLKDYNIKTYNLSYFDNIVILDLELISK